MVVGKGPLTKVFDTLHIRSKNAKQATLLCLASRPSVLEIASMIRIYLY